MRKGKRCTALVTVGLPMREMNSFAAPMSSESRVAGSKCRGDGIQKANFTVAFGVTGRFIPQRRASDRISFAHVDVRIAKFMQELQPFREIVLTTVAGH